MMSYCEMDFDPDDAVNVLSDGECSSLVEHKCCECGIKIKFKERYTLEATTPVDEYSDMEDESFVTCLPCREVRSKMRGVCYGSLYDNLRDCILEGDDLPLEFLDGLSPIALGKLDWHVFADLDDDDE